MQFELQTAYILSSNKLIMHNLSGYDIHLFIKHLGISNKSLKVISQTDEKYIAVSIDIIVGRDEKGKPIKRELRFIDSFKFMASSLDALLDNLKSFPNLKKFFKDEQLELLLKKGVYPYEYVTNVRVFDETELPLKEAFESQLNDTKITDAEYDMPVEYGRHSVVRHSEIIMRYIIEQMYCS
jgi:hypothetical protein